MRRYIGLEVPRDVTVPLTDEQVTELEAMAAAEGISVSQAIQDAILRSVAVWRQAVISERRTWDSVDWRRRVRDHIARKYAQKELPKDFGS